MAGQLQAERELMRDEFAQEDSSRLLPASDARGVVLREPIGQESGTASGADALRAVDVFVSDRNAQEWARVAALQRCLGGTRIGEGTISRQGDEGVQGGVELLDPS